MPDTEPTTTGTPATPRPKRNPVLMRLRIALWVVAALVGLGAGAAIHVLKGHKHANKTVSSAVVETWKANEKAAPAITLQSANGTPLSLAAFRGHPVLVTFIDPFCRDFCPREASILTSAARQLGSLKPAIVAVSVDPWGDTAKNFKLDAVHWKLSPAWRWAVGSYGELAKTWHSYQVAVLVQKQTIAGIPIRRITHTGLAYLVDSAGNERALFLYPFTAADIVTTAQSVLPKS